MSKLKYLIAIALLLLAGQAEANLHFMALSGPTVGSSGAPCTTPADGDIFNEGFIGAGYENGGAFFAETGAPDEDHTLTGAPPAGSCSEGLYVTAANANEYIERDHGSTIDVDTINMDVYAEVQVKSLSLTNFTLCQVMAAAALTNAPTGAALFLEIYNDNGTYKWRVNNSSTSVIIGNVSLNTWVTLRLHLDTAGGNSVGYVDAANQTLARKAATDPRFFFFGTFSIGAGESANIEFGRVWVDTP